MNGPLPPTIWIEVDDIIEYFTRHDQPTGIQRVVFELLNAARQRSRQAVRLCRLNRRSGRFEALDLTGYDAMLTWLRREGRVYQKYGRLHARLGIWARDLYRLRHWRDPGRKLSARHDARAETFFREIQTGAVILSLGGPWLNPRFPSAVRALKSRPGVRFVQLVHDIIPISHADLLDARAIPQFVTWLHETAPLVDFYLTPSRHVAGELQSYAAAQGWPRRSITVIRFGSGFAPAAPVGQEPLPCPVGEPYALCVGTVDLRKNTELLVQIWERLVAKHGRDRVPLLVLAGHRGYRSQAVFTRLQATGFVQGRVRFLERVSNAALEDLYRRAAFTVFPSKAEGWGLPVEESFVYGRPAIVSTATSLPEVGSDLAEYFDPADAEGAYARIERAITDPAHLDRLAERIRKDFRPRSWNETFDQIAEVIGRECALLERGRHDAAERGTGT
ncbi:MAG TPA: glycosyltransferase family 1 protein [Beijerinckiaceae bacterium]|nr:glycosyltransferase family 1 protein [Beijerinckiaceae bacterium]